MSDWAARKIELDQAAFETFATIYPHEAAEMDWARFFAYAQQQKPGISEQEVRATLEVTRG